MIRNLIVNINSDRSVFPKELKVANRYEIKTNVLNIKFSFDLPENSFVYLVLTRNQIQYYYPLINNSFSFGSNETWINGGWIGYVLISKAEIIDGVVNSSEALFISDAFGLTVGDSEFNIEKLEQQELPAQLHLLYDDLLNLKFELEQLIQTGGGTVNFVDLIDYDTKELFRIQVKAGALTMTPIATSPAPIDCIKLYDEVQNKHYFLNVKSGNLIMKEAE